MSLPIDAAASRNGYPARFENKRLAGEVQGEVDVLLDKQDADVLAFADVAHDAKDLLDNQRCQAERRFVEQQQPRPEHQGAADREHLLFPAR